MAISQSDVYDALPDEQLAERSQSGDALAVSELIRRMAPTVNYCASRYQGSSLETADLVQEGMIGLLNAIHTYDSQKNAKFVTYAKTCIANGMLSAIRSVSLKRHIPASEIISIEGEDIADQTLAGPEDKLINREQMEQIHAVLDQTLSRLELDVLGQYLNGCSYEAIAAKLKITEKAVDNAMCRIRGKLKRLQLY